MTNDRERDGAGDDATGVDVETAFAAIVARYADSDPHHGGWPVAEDLSTDTADSGELALGTAGGAGAPFDDPTPIAEPARVLRPSLADPPEFRLLDEHFDPPEPVALPRMSRVTQLAWIGALGGPLLLVLAAMLPGRLPGTLVAAGVVAFIGGFVTLVVRMPDRRADDGPDDGAVV